MAKLQTICPRCGKVAEVRKEERVESLGKIFTTYTCKHTVITEIVHQQVPAGFTVYCMDCSCELKGKEVDTHPQEHDIQWIPAGRDKYWLRARAYQQEGVEFLEKSNFNALLADEQSLGKTIQTLLALRYSKAKLTPTIIVVKSSLRIQWLQEMWVNEWVSDTSNIADLPYVIGDGKGLVLPGSNFYIVSMSLLSKVLSQLVDLKPKLLIVDECQNFSNPSAQRTKALLALAAFIPHKIAMSGTPILNRAKEYWATLNLIKPDHWPSFKSFMDNWVDTDGLKSYGILKYRRQEFFNKTKPYILRRLKKEVLKDLPPFSRNFRFLDVSKEAQVSAYNKTANELQEFLSSKSYAAMSGAEQSANTLAYLQRMRHLSGLLKVVPCIEEVNDFLESSEDGTSKICIGCHHDDVFDSLKLGLSKWNPIALPAGLQAEEVSYRLDTFRKNGHRLAIAKILAYGEGSNIQFCPNTVLLERMWNPSKESQFEARFHRPMKCMTCNALLDKTQPKDENGMPLQGEVPVYECPKCGYTENIIPVQADYYIAKGTVDEHFTVMVEEKRKIVGETLEEDYNLETDPGLIKELAQWAAKMRL